MKLALKKIIKQMKNKIFITQEGKEEIEASLSLLNEKINLYESLDYKIDKCIYTFILLNSEIINHNPLKKTTREVALEWFNEKDDFNKSKLTHKYFKDLVSYNFSLTVSMIEEIYLKEKK